MTSSAEYLSTDYHPFFRFGGVNLATWQCLIDRNTQPVLVEAQRDSGVKVGKFLLGRAHIDFVEEIVEDVADIESALRINSDRLWHAIHFTAQWGALGNTMGMSRLAGSAEDGKARGWFIDEAKKIGCEVRVDEIGNIFAILPGLRADIPPIAMGSHLDTQPAGGRFDGILGVIGALEVLRTIHESGARTYAPLAAVCWTNEEGAAYLSGCTGSSVWAGHQTLQYGLRLPDTWRTTTMGDELSKIGYRGPCLADHLANPLSCHFELHIEQNRRLQDQNKKAGIVTAIQGIRWFRVTVRGEQGHAGSTPMDERADAFLATAKIEILLDRLAREKGAVATVGVIEAGRRGSSSSNTIPGSANFTIDLRCPSESVIVDIVSEVKLEMERQEKENVKLSFEMEQVWHSPAAYFDENMLDCVSKAAEKEVGGTMEMISFAGHDSAMTSLQVPTAMVFIPCRDGVSHAPEEYSSQQQCAEGVQILLNAVIRYDRHLASRQRV